MEAKTDADAEAVAAQEAAEKKQRAVEAKAHADAEAVAAQKATNEKQRVVEAKADADAEAVLVEAIDTQQVADDNQQAAEAGAEAETVIKTGKWTPTEIEKLARSLILNGSRTTYETMSEHATTRSIGAITS